MTWQDATWLAKMIYDDTCYLYVMRRNNEAKLQLIAAKEIAGAQRVTTRLYMGCKLIQR